jgi:hypothetical protein
MRRTKQQTSWDREDPSRKTGRAFFANSTHADRTQSRRVSLQKKVFHPSLPDATFSRFCSRVLILYPSIKMQYRGKYYIIVQGIEPNSWKWTLDLDEHTSKSGEAKTRGLAVSAVVLLVDKLLARKPQSSAA